MIPGLPAPGIILAFVLSLLGAVAFGELHGRHEEKKSWEIALANQRADAAALLAKSEKARSDTERAFNDLKDKTELDHAAQETRIDMAYAANRKLLAGGLYDIKGTAGGTCRGNQVPADPRPAGGAPSSSAGCRLSEETSQSLLNLARDADRAAAYASTCYRWARGLSDAAESTVSP